MWVYTEGRKYRCPCCAQEYAPWQLAGGQKKTIPLLPFQKVFKQHERSDAV